MVIEILVAISIITIGILSMITVAQKSVYVARQSFHERQAVFLLEEGAEAVRLIRDNGWSGIESLSLDTEYYLSYAGGIWLLSTDPISEGIFTRTVSFSRVLRNDTSKDISSLGTEDPDARLVNISVLWREGGTPIEKNVQFYIFNIFQ